MHRTVPTALPASLALLALAGCSAPAVAPGSATPGPVVPATSAAAPSGSAPASPPAQQPAGSTPTGAGTGGGGGGDGTIRLTGAVSGTMTVAVCHDGMAQLVLAVDGQDKRYSGLIDADDFTFVGPGSTGYTLADGTSKPKVSGSTSTVRGTKLVSITTDDTVTANGSVTCP